jgi:hypothetical protein
MMNLSSAYYEILPNASYIDSIPPPLHNKHNLQHTQRALEDLLNIEKATKILLGGQHSEAIMNPIDYAYKGLETNLHRLPRTSDEFLLLHRYITNTSENTNTKLLNIFKVQRKGEPEQFEGHQDKKRMLLYHGSKTCNFMGIFATGLRIAPPSAQITGWAFGKGLYFADMFSKSMGYSYNYWGNLQKETSFMLLCEVAVGKMANALKGGKALEIVDSAPGRFLWGFGF